MLKNAINYFFEKQKMLFLIDSIGALLTAFFLYVVMRQFNYYVGMPNQVLTLLSIVAICFFLYSMLCLIILKRNRGPFIKVIGIANFIYCLLTIAMLFKYHHVLTVIGESYFLVEIVLICILSYIEINVSRKLKTK